MTTENDNLVMKDNKMIIKKYFCYWRMVISVCLMLFLTTTHSQSVQVLPKNIELSTLEKKILPCIWIDGKTLISYPPSPSLFSKISSQLSTFLPGIQKTYPASFDPFYIQRMLPTDILMNTLIPYRNLDYSQDDLYSYQILDQFSEDDFLYYIHQTLNKEESLGLYFRVQPYQKKSKLLFSLPLVGSESRLSYVGYLSETKQYCFITENHLVLYDTDKHQMVIEQYFPSLSKALKTDNQSLFLFIDTNKTLNAYSIKHHKVMWQNKTLLADHSFDQFNTEMITISTLPSSCYISYYKRSFLLVSLLDGKEIASINNPDIIPAKSVREVNGALWIPFYLINTNGDINRLYFEKITCTKDNQISVDFYELDFPITSVLKKTDSLGMPKPVFLVFIPAYHKILIIAKDDQDHEHQAVYDLP